MAVSGVGEGIEPKREKEKEKTHEKEFQIKRKLKEDSSNDLKFSKSRKQIICWTMLKILDPNGTENILFGECLMEGI